VIYLIVIRIARELERIAELRGYPCMMVSDNGTDTSFAKRLAVLARSEVSSRAPAADFCCFTVPRMRNDGCAKRSAGCKVLNFASTGAVGAHRVRSMNRDSGQFVF
jgi:hypothetical protein